METVYSDTATEAYMMEWAGERYTVQPIPTGLDGIHVLAARLNITIEPPPDLNTLVPAIQQAAQEGERPPQIRTLLRTAAAELVAAARLTPGIEDRWNAITQARTHLIAAWKTAPGSSGFVASPDGTAQCILCGTTSPDLRTNPTTAYADATALHEWYDRHSDLCQPLPRPACRECLCGGCKAGPSPVHWCSPCTCYNDADQDDAEQ